MPLIALRYGGLRDSAAYATSFAAILAVAVGAAVAWRAGGGRALALFIAVHVLQSVATLPGALLFCDRSGESGCGMRWAIGQWRTVAGLIVALGVVRPMRTGEPGHMAGLNALGGYVAAHQLLTVPVAALTFTAVRSLGDATGQVVFLSVASIAAAAVAGVVLGLRGGSWIASLVPIYVIMQSWAIGLWPMFGFAELPPWFAASAATGPIQVIALLVGRAVSWAREHGMQAVRS